MKWIAWKLVGIFWAEVMNRLKGTDFNEDMVRVNRTELEDLKGEARLKIDNNYLKGRVTVLFTALGDIGRLALVKDPTGTMKKIQAKVNGVLVPFQQGGIVTSRPAVPGFKEDMFTPKGDGEKVAPLEKLGHFAKVDGMTREEREMIEGLRLVKADQEAQAGKSTTEDWDRVLAKDLREPEFTKEYLFAEDAEYDKDAIAESMSRVIRKLHDGFDDEAGRRMKVTADLVGLKDVYAGEMVFPVTEPFLPPGATVTAEIPGRPKSKAFQGGGIIPPRKPLTEEQLSELQDKDTVNFEWWKSSGQLPDDWEDKYFLLDGEIYSLPTHGGRMTDGGNTGTPAPPGGRMTEEQKGRMATLKKMVKHGKVWTEEEKKEYETLQAMTATGPESPGEGGVNEGGGSPDAGDGVEGKNDLVAEILILTVNPQGELASISITEQDHQNVLDSLTGATITESHPDVNTLMTKVTELMASVKSSVKDDEPLF